MDISSMENVCVMMDSLDLLVQFAMALFRVFSAMKLSENVDLLTLD